MGFRWTRLIGIFLEIVGSASTKWQEKGIFKSFDYGGTELYLSSIINLQGSEQNDKYTIIPGTHTYSFNFQLPLNCPSSFEGLYGCIRYVVQVKLLRPWEYDLTYPHGITVLQSTDFNISEPRLWLPCSTSAYRIFCIGPCKTAPLSLQLKVPHAGYVPGQVIPINVLVINDTYMAVNELELSLVMLMRYSSTTPTKHSHIERITLARAKGDLVPQKCTRALTESLRVPSTPPTSSASCSLIEIIYQVEVVAKMPAFFSNQVLTVPVTIITQPLRNDAMISLQPTFNRTAVSAGQQQIAELPIMTPLSSDNLGIGLSSFEAALHTEYVDLNENNTNGNGAVNFTPLYPVYNIY